jgi:L-seryl-tRNA(Ser) seleniumtransferase
LSTNKLTKDQQRLLREIPAVDQLLQLGAAEPDLAGIPRSVMVKSARILVADIRSDILDRNTQITGLQLKDQALLKALKTRVRNEMTPNLRRTINATGIVIHTNLGRSRLSESALENLHTISNRYSNLELDLSTGKRGSRYSAVEDILCEISGAESGLVVNNNAGAVLLTLETLARGKDVIVSRGELVEIGGSFRIPDIMARSGANLKEVGSTNRTHLKDYAAAIDNNTGLLLKVHQSNYSIVGFTTAVALNDLVQLGRQHSLPVLEDLGSGTFIDFSSYGLIKEPTVQESVAAGVSVVTFSGDKLLGGPQAGLIVGQTEFIDRIKMNPVNRALRIDKMTLAALESTLRLYRDPQAAVRAIPTLRMLTMKGQDIERKAEALKAQLDAIDDPRLQIRLLDCASKTGGGSLPLMELPSRCISVKMAHLSANTVESYLRMNSPPIVSRIEEDTILMDLRTIQKDEIIMITNAFKAILKRTDHDA